MSMLGPLRIRPLFGLILFGNRLPKVMRSLGQSVTEFKQGLHEPSTDDDST